MEDDFGQSLTPPVSPFEPDSQCDFSPARPPWFSCAFEPSRDEARTVSSEGYIARGSLKRLMLRLDPAPGDCEADTVELFGFPWVTETALVESSNFLFSLFKQKILSLESLVQNSSHDFAQASSLHFEAEALRQQCVQFLQYVKVFTFRFVEPPRALDEGVAHPYEDLEAQFPSALLEELFGVTLLIGRLRDLPANVQSSFTIHHQGKLFPPSWHLLHLYLDCHWSLLEILHLLGEKMQSQVVYAHQFVNLTGENLTSVSLFEEHLNSLLCDLISMAMNKYSKVRPTEALTTQHYHCTCTKELWILIRHLLEHRSRVLHTQSFWSYISAPLQGHLKGESQAGLPSPCRDTLGFTWWLVTQLADLGQYSRNGTLHSEKVEDNWSLVIELLKLTCSPQGGLQEEQVRMHVHCCLSLCLLWDSNSSAVTTLWEYYCKNLNASFTVPWLGVAGLCSVSRTPLALLEKARVCCSREPRSPSLLRSAGHAQLYRSANSFHIFLRILALHLTQDGAAAGAPWRQMKGRIYSKFHQRRMKELSEGGLSNFLLLFLVLARAGELEDVAARTFDLLELLSPPPLGPALQALVWRGQLALLLLFVEKGLDVGALAERLGAAFARVAREFYLKTTEPARKLALWGPLESYLEGAEEVFQTSAFLHLSEERLLNQGFSLLLPACRPSEINSALGFVQSILAQLQRVLQRCAQLSHTAAAASPPPSVAKERHLAVAGALWANLFPFLRSSRLSQTPPAQLADSAAGFTLLALELPGSAPQDLQPHPVLSIMQFFSWDDMLHPLLVTRYLIHLLQNSALVSSLSAAGSGSAQAQCVRAWVRSVLQQHLHRSADGTDSRAGRALADLLPELTRLVFQLPEVESLLQGAGLPSGASRQEPVPALATFIKAVGRAYSRLESLAERSGMVTRALEYVGDVLKHIKPYLVNKGPPEGLQLAYWAVGCVVKQWSPLLATSKAQQLLFRIVDVLLLPHAVFQQDKGLSPQVLSAVKENLPLYLQGLSVAAGVAQIQGAYLKQQLHSVTSHYLGRFLPATPSTATVANHPVLLAVCETSPNPQGATLRKAILQVLSENFLQFKGHAPPPRLASVLAFLLELLRRMKDLSLELLTLPLPAVLRCLMLVNEPQVRKLSTDVLQLVVERCASREGPCDQLSAVLKCFIEENAGVYDQQVYSILETVAILDQSVVSGLVPVLSQSLRNTETKRGLGRNTTLRNAYRKLLSHLGEGGQIEMISLEED
ncbi:protein MMS22-like [Anguilla rostrata]|uniref:protein MMS22-like n=1 Tax=Anguilla rostrata TaxID=7938 RepID=UPI0030D38931